MAVFTQEECAFICAVMFDGLIKTAKRPMGLDDLLNSLANEFTAPAANTRMRQNIIRKFNLDLVKMRSKDEDSCKCDKDN